MLENYYACQLGTELQYGVLKSIRQAVAREACGYLFMVKEVDELVELRTYPLMQVPYLVTWIADEGVLVFEKPFRASKFRCFS